MIIAILTASLFLRLIALNQSFWLDEAISANVAGNLGFLEIIKNFSVHDFHPPLYYLFLNTWEKIFDNSEISLRIPSIIFSLITIYFVYLIGKLLKNKNTGLWAAVLVGFNPLLIYFSQEVRMYSLTVMLTTLALYNFVKIINNKKYTFLNYFGINLFSFLSFLTFYGSIFMISSFGFYFLIKRDFRKLIISNVGIVLAILILFPLTKIQFINSKTALENVINWDLVLGKANLKNLLLIPLKFSIGRISFEPKFFYYLVGGLWTGLLFMIAFIKFYKNKLLTYLFFVPLLLGLIFSFYSPLMQYFRFLYLIPILGLLIANSNNKKLKLMIVTGFFIFSLYYLFNPSTHREDWKNLSGKLENKVYMIESFSDPIKYYRPDIQISDIRSEIIEKEILVVPYGEEIHGVDHNQLLSQQNYKKIKEMNFREVNLEKWEFFLLNH